MVEGLPDQQVGDDVVVGEVPAHRDVGLVQGRARAGVGEGDAAEADDDVPVARQQVDALERVVRVADDRVGLLDPVERCPLDDDPAAEVGVVGSERRGRDGVLADDEVVATGRGCGATRSGPGRAPGGAGRAPRARRTARARRRRRRAARHTSARPGEAPRPARHRWCRAPARRRARPAPAWSPARSAARRCRLVRWAPMCIAIYRCCAPRAAVVNRVAATGLTARRETLSP